MTLNFNRVLEVADVDMREKFYQAISAAVRELSTVH